MQTLLVTIDGPAARYDLQVPAEVPIRELIPMLLEVCRIPQAPRQRAGREQWQLTISGVASPLHMQKSLVELGILDGMVLSLRDHSLAVTTQTKQQSQSSFQPLNIQPAGNTVGIGVRWNLPPKQ